METVSFCGPGHGVAGTYDGVQLSPGGCPSKIVQDGWLKWVSASVYNAIEL